MLNPLIIKGKTKILNTLVMEISCDLPNNVKRKTQRSYSFNSPLLITGFNICIESRYNHFLCKRNTLSHVTIRAVAFELLSTY